MGSYTLSSPIIIERPRTNNYSLNLNIYRNSHFQTLNQMKVKYGEIMADEIDKLPVLGKVRITYTLNPKTKRLCDISNVCCIVDKFFCDCLVQMGKLEDDNYLLVPEVVYKIGEVDKVGTMEILIEEI